MSRARVILTGLRLWLPVLGVFALLGSMVVVIIYGLKASTYSWWLVLAFVTTCFVGSGGRRGNFRSDFLFPALSVLALLIACFGQR